MNRRAMLAASAGLVGTLAGCSGSPRSGADPETASPDPSQDPPAGAPPADGTPGVSSAPSSVSLPVPRAALREALPQDYIPAIVDPVFGDDWDDLEVPDSSLYDGGPLLPDDAVVIGVEHRGEARAYPLRILDWHEVVNDTFGAPLLVTYCPLCGSGIVARRTVAGAPTRFGVSGKLWRQDLVLYDARSESLWSQILATAIRGPHTGDRLALGPLSLTTWREWRDTHPETSVLLPPPRSNTVRGREATFDYFSEKYSYQDEDQIIGFDGDRTDSPLHQRTLVIGITANGEARAYPFGVVREADVINDTLGGSPVVVTVTPANTLVAYDRRVGGTSRTFEPDGDEAITAAGTTWRRTDGRGVAGRHTGTRLTPATDRSPMFWKGWSNFYPETTVYG